LANLQEMTKKRVMGMSVSPKDRAAVDVGSVCIWNLSVGGNLTYANQYARVAMQKSGFLVM
jgi:hypothetical protein